MENAVKTFDGVLDAQAYLYFDTEINEMSPAVKVFAEDGVTEETVLDYMNTHYEGTMVPKVVNVEQDKSKPV